jgi:hypothetical protein
LGVEVISRMELIDWYLQMLINLEILDRKSPDKINKCSILGLILEIGLEITSMEMLISDNPQLIKHSL